MLTSEDLKPFRSIKYSKSEIHSFHKINQHKVVLPKLDAGSIQSILLPKLKNDGLCIVSSSETKLSDLAELVPYFGQSVNQGKSTIESDNLNHFIVQVVAESRIAGLTSKDQAMHVDGFYGRKLPGIIALYCSQQAEIGGESVLADGFAVYKFLERTYPQGLEALKDPEALEFEFLVGGGTKIKLPVFRELEDRRIEFFYTPYAKTITGSQEAEIAYKLTSRFVHTTQNQLRYRLKDGEFMLLDNSRYTHGRYSFSGSKQRMLNRVWYTGLGLDLGFTV